VLPLHRARCLRRNPNADHAATLGLAVR
jgi:hypothetical protein